MLRRGWLYQRCQITTIGRRKHGVKLWFLVGWCLKRAQEGKAIYLKKVIKSVQKLNETCLRFYTNNVNARRPYTTTLGELQPF